MEGKVIRILFVCLGNICRSPAADGIMRQLIEKRGLQHSIDVDSAGTYAGHQGELPDRRMREHAAKRGYSLTHRSRPVVSSDFEQFDLLIAMDDANFSNLQRMAPDVESTRKIVRMVDYCTAISTNHVPDPYYGGYKGFEFVLDILEDACRGLLDQLAAGSRGSISG